MYRVYIDQLNSFPKAKLTVLPTPLYQLDQLSKKMGGPKLFIKREDLTSLAFGGSKARQLQFTLGEAVSLNSDVLITAGRVQSNHNRMAAAASRQLGLEPKIVLAGTVPKISLGNYLLLKLMDVDLKHIPIDEYDNVQLILEEWAKYWKSKGRNPYILPRGGHTPLSSIAYVEAMFEIISQARQLDVNMDHLVLASGSGATQAGLIVGKKIFGSNIDIIGISIRRPAHKQKERVLAQAQEVVEVLKWPISITIDDIDVRDYYDHLECYRQDESEAGDDSQCIQAIKTLAQCEGIFLDTVYTGRAMAWLLKEIKCRQLGKSSNVLFLHTGGNIKLFADYDYIT